MSFKHKFIGLGFSFLLVILVIFFTLISLYFYIPTYVESRLIPEIAHKAGIRSFACNVRRIGVFGADLGSVRIGTDKNPALSIASVQIDYSPKKLLQKEIKRAILSGIELFCEYKNGEFKIRQFNVKRFLEQLQSSKKPTSSSTDASQTISIGRLEVRNAVVVFKFKGKSLRLPIELEIVPKKIDQRTSDRDVWACMLQLYPRGQKIVFAADLDRIKNQILLKFDADAVHLERFADIATLVPGLIVSGEADIKGQALLQYRPFKLSFASACCQFRNADIVYNHFKLKNFQNTQKEKRPLKIEINGTGGKEWKFSGTAISAVSPIPAKVTHLNGDVRILKDTVTVSGDLTVLIEPLNGHRTTSVNVLEPLEVKGNYVATLAENGTGEFRVHNTDPDKSTDTPKSCKFKINDMEVVTNLPVFDISGTWEPGNAFVDYNVVASNVTAFTTSGRLKTPYLSLNGNARPGNSTRNGQGFSVFELIAQDTNVPAASTTLNLPVVSLSGKLFQGKDHDLHVDGVFKFDDMSVTDSTHKTKINGIRGRLPLKWPFQGTGKKGNYFAKKLRWKHLNLGLIRGTVWQKDLGLVFNGAHISSLLPNLSLNFTGNAGVSSSNDYQAGVHFVLNPYKTVSDIDLGQFFAGAKGVTLNGEFGLNGDVTIDSSGFKSSLKANVKNANLMLKEKGAAVEGIQTVLNLTDVFNIGSGPKQAFYFKKAWFGGLNIHDGNIEYQIESATSFFIERGGFGWCDGNVYTQAMRISPGINDYNLTLFCDRLKLAMILEQFGTVNAKGNGTVNGRLPVIINNGKIRFSDGFLFSTPGQGGAIRLTGTEILTAGIPADTPQYAQIELAIEALKDYDYDWAKLNLRTEGENVLLRLQFDGKPARPLPFVYNKDIGGFAKVEAGGKGSVFQGINLDVNFKVPLDKILKYKDILEMME